MAKVRFVCLANSFKEGGRCVAGIVLDDNNNLENGIIRWIRPVANTTVHGEIPPHLVNNIKILDIVEVDVINYPNSEGYQSENVLFVEVSMTVLGRYNNSLDVLCSSNKLIFGNRGKAISEEGIATLNHSLMFIKTSDFEVYQRIYEDNPRPQIRIKFTYNANQYDLPITDPVFLKNYQSNPNFLTAYNQINMTISVGVIHNGWYYKLVAGIILS
jgi:hypothetical protein